MTNKLLDAPPITMKSGDEHIIGTDKKLLDFWRWGFSDVLNNTTRGIFAEHLVATALGIATSPRITVDPYDLTYNGLTIEVKSCAYIQSWKQRRPSKVSFDIAETRLYDYEKGTYVGEKKRQADVYLFALLIHTDRETINPLDASQWMFYVMPTSLQDEKLGSQQKMSFSTLLKLGASAVSISEIPTSLATLMVHENILGLSGSRSSSL
jgi:hypothetical protein